MQYNHFITGRIIRELREQRGLTQEVLSGLAAVLARGYPYTNYTDYTPYTRYTKNPGKTIGN